MLKVGTTSDATRHKMFIRLHHRGREQSPPDKGNCVWEDQRTALLSPIPPGWAAATSPVLLGTHISLKHNPTHSRILHGSCQQSLSYSSSFGLCVSEGTVTTQREDKQAIISCFYY